MEKDIGGSNEKSQTVNLSDVTWNLGKQVSRTNVCFHELTYSQTISYHLGIIETLDKLLQKG